MSHELHLRYRPTRIKDVVGQPKACKLLTEFLKTNTVPRTTLFSGPPGVGKTSLARIMAGKLGCVGMDCQEINAAQDRGIDTVRDIRSKVGISPAQGRCRIWIIDEAQCLTTDAQSGLLKVLEDVPSHVYFFLATTDPGKIKLAIRTRATLIQLRPLPPQDVHDLLTSIATRESVVVSEEVIHKITEVSYGSAREAVKLLNSVIQFSDDESRLQAIEDPVEKRVAYDLVRKMVWQKATWPQIAEMIRTIEIGDVESFRQLVLGCANKELLKGGPGSTRAWMIIEEFRQSFHEFHKAAIAYACFAVMDSKK